MAGWTKMEKRKVTQFKDGAIYKTKVVGFEWFPINAQPPTNQLDPEGFIWCNTLDYHFGKDKPTT